MPDDLKFEIACQVATQQQWPEALLLVFSHEVQSVQQAKAMQTLVGAKTGDANLDGLIVALHDDQVVGTIWAILAPGKTALIATPATTGANSQKASIRSRLFEQLDLWLADNGVLMCQVLLEDNVRDSEALFLRHGYQTVSELHYLEAKASVFPTAPPDTTNLEFRKYTHRDQASLAKAIDRTYEETLDCPLLNGRRQESDVLEGYRDTGDSKSEWWWLLVFENEIAGCLLLAEHRALTRLELVYVGIAPDFRGHKIGFLATQFALWQAKQLEQEAVVLAVDSKNLPAVNAYHKAGFEVWDRRLLLLKFCP